MRSKADETFVIVEILVCLTLLASGSFQKVSKDFINVLQATVSRISKKFR